MRPWRFSLLMLAAGAGVFALALAVRSDYLFFAGYVVLQFIVLATAWNILGGYCGYVNFGTAAFFAIGTYTTVALHKIGTNSGRYLSGTLGELLQPLFPLRDQRLRILQDALQPILRAEQAIQSAVLGQIDGRRPRRPALEHHVADVEAVRRQRLFQSGKREEIHRAVGAERLVGDEDSDARLAHHYRLDAVRAHLLEMTGDYESAIQHYRIAASRTTSIPEQNYLMTQAARLDDNTKNPDKKIVQ